MIAKAIFPPTAVALLLLLILLPLATFGNGGDQRVYGNEFLVNLSRSPFTPIAGTPTAMTATFVDLKTGNPIQEKLLVTTRVYKGRGGQELLRVDENVPVESGILDLSHTFTEPGIHEIYFDFAYAEAPEERIEPPDFLIDVQPPEDARWLDGFTVVLIAGGFIAAFLVGFGLGRNRKGT